MAVSTTKMKTAAERVILATNIQRSVTGRNSIRAWSKRSQWISPDKAKRNPYARSNREATRVHFTLPARVLGRSGGARPRRARRVRSASIG